MPVTTHAGSVSIVAAVDGYATDEGADGTFETLDTTSGAINTRDLFRSEDRGIIEFDISGISSSAKITSATLTMRVILTQGSGPTIEVFFFGYAGNGVVGLDDATGSTLVVGTLSDAELGEVSIPIDVGFIQSLVGSADYLGLMTRTFGGDGVLLTSIDASFFPPPPTLELEFEQVIFVDAGATGSANDGRTWGNAYVDLQAALDAASSGGEIWVAAGRYIPSRRSDEADARTATFQLANAASIYGGFAGDEEDRHERDLSSNETILTGDLGDDNDRSNNAYHVVTGSGTDSTAVLDGFTITKGYANNDALAITSHGGGMNNITGSPTVRNCVFVENSAISTGGGMYNKGGSNPTVINCVFQRNWGFSAGTVNNRDNSDATFINCTIIQNFSGIEASRDSNLTLANCILWNNGGTELWDQIFGFSGSTITHCCIQGWTSPGVDGNINDDPMFVDRPYSFSDRKWDVRLRPGSPCNDAGDNTALPADEDDLDGDGMVAEPFPLDLDGKTRFGDDACTADTGQDLPAIPQIVDMGAYEFVPLFPMPTARLFVKSDADGAQDGANWDGAFANLQDALGSASDYPCIADEVWVATGTYKPSTNGDRGATFQLVTDVAVYGGFSGDESVLSERDANPATNHTVLSGDIGTPSDTSDNSFTVVTGSLVEATAILDGFTITGGNADGESPFSPEAAGGGVFNAGGSPTLRNCVIASNMAVQGGGMCNLQESHPVLERCTLSDNSVPDANIVIHAIAGGVYNLIDSAPTFRDCRFINNSAPNSVGGALYSSGSRSGVLLTGCLFQGNSAFRGGAIALDGGTNSTLINCQFIENESFPTDLDPPFPPFGGGMVVLGGEHHLVNCLFHNNATTDLGGGMISVLADLTLSGCTFSKNMAGIGGGVYVAQESLLTATNSIFWGNADADGTNVDESAQILDDPSFGTNVISVGYSCVQDSDPSDDIVYPGTGNMDEDPQFVDPDGSASALIVGSDLSLRPTSTAINAGDPDFATPPGATGLDGHARILCDRVDMGAYEFGLGDNDCDRDVDLRDLAALQRCFAGSDQPLGQGCISFDTNGDGHINLIDQPAINAVLTRP